jgi:hypothetical protein
VRASENLLEHEGVDEHHAVLEQVQAEHAQCLSGKKLNDLRGLCFHAGPEMGTADVDQ